MAYSELQRPIWWKEKVVYQIYPSSFCDSNGDGIGDLNGIASKLDYLKALGVDIVWLSPIYRSPLADMGYDISDYRNIDPRYGTLADWDLLLKGLHDRGMKLMMDLVVNHSSDQHEWFIESRSSKANPKRDWYIWRPPKYDEQGNRHPPNNWESIFEGSAWQWDEKTEEYYLHIYLDSQPDLNWENSDVREAVYDMMKFWLDKGCDGFRMDVINLISKAEGLPDAPIVKPGAAYQPASIHYANGPRVHEYIQEMNSQVLSKYDIITVGEAPFTHSATQLAEYVLPANRELNMVFSFELMDVDSRNPTRHVEPKEWKLTEFKKVVERWQTLLREEGFWNSVYIENHDQARSVSRWANDTVYRDISAKMLAILQITQTGTLYVYQGEEIGMANVPRNWPLEEYKDVATQNYYKSVLKERRQKGEGDDMSDILDAFQKKARDNARTPMQWDATKHAGFSTGTPWMRVNDDYPLWNVAAQINTPSSVWSFWKQALQIRKAHDVLIYGDFQLLDRENEEVFAYTRTLGTTTALVLLNFTGRDGVRFAVDQLSKFSGAKPVLANYGSDLGNLPAGVIELKAYEGRVYVK